MIAYVDAGLRVNIAGSDGADSRPLKAVGKAHAWPGWSPEGTRLVFSSISSGNNGSGALGLYLQQIGEGQPQLIYRNKPGTDAIAQRTPHYALWAPDGSRLAFITRTWNEGLSLFVLDALGEPDSVRHLIDGMPLFIAWSPDGRHLLVHRGENHYLADVVERGDLVEVPGASRRYAAPSWSPAGTHFTIMRESGDGRHVMLLADVQSGRARSITEVEGSVAFAWSPGGDTICMARDALGRSRFFGGLWLVDTTELEERRLTEDAVLSFFWSPGGERIAYVTTTGAPDGSVRWAVLEVETGSTRYLATFVPTEEQVLAYMFFDQYAQSHNPWSPDGRKLMFAGSTGDETGRAVLPRAEEASVLVADVDGEGTAQAIAQGILGFWSPV